MIRILSENCLQSMTELCYKKYFKKCLTKKVSKKKQSVQINVWASSPWFSLFFPNLNRIFS
jgi:hypothetical protein